MTKVHLNPPDSIPSSKPSEQIIAKSQAKIRPMVTDSRGRVFKLRIPRALDQFDLNSALGKDAENAGCVGMASALLFIESIDGESFSPPKSFAQVRAAIDRVDTDGFQAINDAVMEYVQERGLTAQEQIESIKK